MDPLVYAILKCPMIVRLILLTMANTYQVREVLLFMWCLRWLIRPILARNLLLQRKREAEEESSVCDAFFFWLSAEHVYSALLILFASYSTTHLLMRWSHEKSSVFDAFSGFPLSTFFARLSLISFASYSSASLLMRPNYFGRSCAICFHDSVGMLESLKETLRVSLYCFF